MIIIPHLCYEKIMIKFPMKFEMSASSGPGAGTEWKGQAGNHPPICCSIPPEFMGPGNGYSPEDLFGLALLNCLIATFKVYTEKGGASFREIRGKVILTIDRIPGESGFAMTQADVSFDISGASDPEKIKKFLDAAIRDCAVSNSIKTGKTFHINFS